MEFSQTRNALDPHLPCPAGRLLLLFAVAVVGQVQVFGLCRVSFWEQQRRRRFARPGKFNTNLEMGHVKSGVNSRNERRIVAVLCVPNGDQLVEVCM